MKNFSYKKNVWLLFVLLILNSGSGLAMLSWNFIASTYAVTQDEDLYAFERHPWQALLAIFFCSLISIPGAVLDFIQNLRNILEVLPQGEKALLGKESITQGNSLTSKVIRFGKNRRTLIATSFFINANSSYVSVPLSLARYMPKYLPMILIPLGLLLFAIAAWPLTGSAKEKADELFDGTEETTLVVSDSRRTEQLTALNNLKEATGLKHYFLLVLELIATLFSEFFWILNIITNARECMHGTLSEDETFFGSYWHNWDAMMVAGAFALWAAIGSAICHFVAATVGEGDKLDIIESKLASANIYLNPWLRGLMAFLLTGDLIGHTGEYVGAFLLVIDMFIKNPVATLVFQMVCLVIGIAGAITDFVTEWVDLTRALIARKLKQELKTSFSWTSAHSPQLFPTPHGSVASSMSAPVKPPNGYAAVKNFV